MDTIKEIVNFLDGYKIRNIDIIGNDTSKSRYTAIYKLLRDGNLKTDEDVAQFLYGKNILTTHSKYRFFKSDFKDKLLNTILFIDSNNPALSNYEKIVYKATRDWVSIEILFKRGIYNAAVALAEQLLKTAIKYEITDLTVKICERLKNVYLSQFENIKMYEYHKQLFWQYKEVLDAEYIAKDVLQIAKIDFITHPTSKSSEIAESSLNSIKPYIGHVKSSNFLISSYSIKIAIYYYRKKYEKVIELCDEAINIFNNKKLGLENIVAGMTRQKVVCLFLLKKLSEAYSVLEYSNKLHAVGNFHWFSNMELQMLITFHTHNYTEGYNLYHKVIRVKQFKHLEDKKKEIWDIFKAYLYILIKLGKITNVGKSDLYSFKLKKFLNTVPSLSNDKKGMNISILIAQIVILIIDRRKEALDDKLQSIEKYVTRHVKRNDIETYRANQFIKLLLEIPKSGFILKEINRNKKVILKKITSIESTIIPNSYKVEIIPYEHLWSELELFLFSK